VTAFLARQERFDRVGSTNDVVRDWLAAGTGEVCLAIAREQTSGRGRAGRSWVAPPGGALLLSLGFRPTWLAPARAWQLAAAVSLAMAGAAETVADLPDRTIRLKWPNDLVVDGEAAGVRKLAGVLGETQGLGTSDPRVVVGLGINADWPATDFPSELASSMTSLREASGGRPIDLAELREAFLVRLEGAIDALRDGRFEAAEWGSRQLTSGRFIRLERPDGSETVRALGVDTETGALVVEDPGAPNGARQVLVGEIGHVRLAQRAPSTAAV
jgi:BirA family biotin operon repressor/biotin-[acetyl-CoA-carboxylase] ligase